VKIINGAVISTSTRSQGHGGDVSITANSLIIDGDGSIAANAGPGSSGDAGDVVVQADDLAITGGGSISVNAVGQGDGGNVKVTSDLLYYGWRKHFVGYLQRRSCGQCIGDWEPLRMEGEFEGLGGVSTAISSGTFGDGNGGNVAVIANSLFRVPLAIAAETVGGAGSAGNVLVHAGTLRLIQNGFITSSTIGPAAGAGGNVAIFCGFDFD
jgi:hypothetical protein